MKPERDSATNRKKNSIGVHPTWDGKAPDEGAESDKADIANFNDTSETQSQELEKEKGPGPTGRNAYALTRNDG